MRFLLEAMAAQNRRILIEEMLLLILRCLWIWLLAMALARPLIPGRSAIPWMIVTQVGLLALVGVLLAAQMRFRGRLGRWLLVGAIACVLGVLATGAAEYMLRAASGQPRRRNAT